MSTVSIEPSTSPTPSSHKLNGSINQRINISTLGTSSSKHHHGSVSTPTSKIGHSSTPLHVNPQNASIMGPPSIGVANITLNSNATTKPLLDISRTSIHPGSVLDTSRRTPNITLKETTTAEDDDRHGIYQMLASLALLCVLSLLMSFLALFFLQKLGPMMSAVQTLEPPSSDRSSVKSTYVTKAPPKRIVVTSEEYVTVYQVSVALSTLTISLDLCCLFVCCIQFLFAIKLLKTPQGDERTHKFLKRSSHTRILAIGGFFLSIPLFFTGIILFTFIHFNEVPAMATSIVIGLGIVFCGVASVHNVYLWQWEKTRACKDLQQSRLSQLGLDCSAQRAVELSTLV
ncbi:uncharacterized protein TNIN_82661 [Trichonephila inaurata madagascariensis]|uniref:Uncharacterized protein n=1 Tax=Trichonephila inaurata madagascariensis TaxID=2747483 RepID=A0A8X7BZ08_9ARAC|nr:uncharacterized protein TNIN_82661 [Trichonephila inaurata madagascariensis]